MDKIEIRPCLPDDVEKAVPLIYESGPSAFNYVFTNHRTSALDFLAHAFQREGGEFSYDNHFAVLANGQFVGIGSIFSGPRASGFMWKDIQNILRHYRYRAIPVLIRGLKIEQILKLPKKNEFCLAHLAISETERSKGYGEQLIQTLMQGVDKKPADYFVLDVSEENPRAQQLYERIGFKVHKHIRSTHKTQHGYVPNFFRMELR